MLNVGAEILDVIRNTWGDRKAYLRGLTQREEKQEGVDCFAQLSDQARLFAFQFKPPKSSYESQPYRYTLVKEQHDLLFELARISPTDQPSDCHCVFYVLPFYVTPKKLQQYVPHLSRDTWLLPVGQIDPSAQCVRRTKVKSCVLPEC